VVLTLAKKDKKKKDKKLANYDANIVRANIADSCKEFMRVFGNNNNLMRHIPEVLDGLKIGERRILYSMYRSGLHYNKPRLKVQSIVGNAMKYHPHGDAALKDTLVKLAQPWYSTQPFIDGQGNFGSPAGDEAASGRYIEARLSYYAYKCFFEEFDQGIVDMRDNYLGNDVEPEYLPAKYPNAVINTSFGIGFGLASSIATYNFKESCLAAIDLIEDPNADIVLVPDSPTGAYIVDDGQFPEISRTGKGQFRMRGVIDIDEATNSLIITSTPLMTSWLKIKDNIIKLLGDSKNNLIRDIDDDSDDDNMRWRITLKKEADPVAVRHLIYSKTNMQKVYGINFNFTENYENIQFTLKSMLLTWIEFRRDTKRRYYTHILVSNIERAHILDTLIMITNKDNAEKTVNIFKNANNTKDCAKALIKEYGISSLQAQTIADMKFSALTKDSRKKYIDEREKVAETITKTEKILDSDKKIDKEIIKELKEGIELFGVDRRSEIITVDNEVKVRDTDHVVVFTKNGLIKKLPANAPNVGTIAQGDEPLNVITINNTLNVLIFDSKGNVNKLPIHKIPNTLMSNPGFKLSDYCTISGRIVCVKAMPTPEDLEKIKVPSYYIMITKNGLIKKTPVDAFMNIRTGLLGIVIKDGDELVCCKTLVGDKDIVVYSDDGMGTRFNSSEITETGRMSVGVLSMPLNDGEGIIGLDILNNKDKFLLVITNKGFAKKCDLSTFETKGRNSKALRLVTVDDNDSVNLIRTIRGDETFNVFTTSGKETISCKDDVVTLPRLSKGRKLIAVKRSDVLIGIREVK
jgi:DNA gyrase subunit A